MFKREAIYPTADEEVKFEFRRQTSGHSAPIVDVLGQSSEWLKEGKLSS